MQNRSSSPKTSGLSWNIDPDARAGLEAEIFGKHVIITDHDHWPVIDVIAGYRSQSEAEGSFRQMKATHVVSFSPMFHWTEHNIRVHTFTCVLALQIAHLMRLQAHRDGLHLSVRELLHQLAGIGEAVLIYPSTGGRAQSPTHAHRNQRPTKPTRHHLPTRSLRTPELGHRPLRPETLYPASENIYPTP